MTESECSESALLGEICLPLPSSPLDPEDWVHHFEILVKNESSEPRVENHREVQAGG